jgi:hypothetical protein
MKQKQLATKFNTEIKKVDSQVPPVQATAKRYCKGAKKQWA